MNSLHIRNAFNASGSYIELVVQESSFPGRVELEVHYQPADTLRPLTRSQQQVIDFLAGHRMSLRDTGANQIFLERHVSKLSRELHRFGFREWKEGQKALEVRESMFAVC